MTTTLGQLVSELVESYEREYRDPELAAAATTLALEAMSGSHAAIRLLQEDVPARRGR